MEVEEFTPEEAVKIMLRRKKKRIGRVTTYCISFLQGEERKAQFAPNKQFIIRRPIWPHVEVTRQTIAGWVISV